MPLPEMPVPTGFGNDAGGQDSSWSRDQDGNKRKYCQPYEGKKWEKENELCQYYLNGHCQFGDNCYRVHSDAPDAVLQKDPCPYFATGFCGFGDECFFSHVEPAKEVCQHWMKGFCSFGDRCFKDHTGTPRTKKQKTDANEAWEDGAGGAGGVKVNRRQSDVTRHIDVPAKGVKDIMGVHGSNIKKIQQMSGVYKVKLLDQEGCKQKGPDDIVTVEIIGNAPAAEVAAKMVAAVAEGDQSCIGNIEETMELEPRLVSKIIGTGGEVIQQMQRQTNTRLAIRSGERGSNQLPRLIMIGPPENVAHAKALVEEYIRQHEGRPSQETRIVPPEEEVNEAWPWQE